MTSPLLYYLGLSIQGNLMSIGLGHVSNALVYILAGTNLTQNGLLEVYWLEFLYSKSLINVVRAIIHKITTDLKTE